MYLVIPYNENMWTVTDQKIDVLKYMGVSKTWLGHGLP